jgi:hypothetical protein
VVPKHAEVEWDGRCVAAGQERHEVDIRVTRKEGVTMSGTYTIPKGSVPPRITLRGVDEPRSPDPYLREVRGQTPNGQFEFAHVPPGTYELEARHPERDAPKAGELSAAQQIDLA